MQTDQGGGVGGYSLGHNRSGSSAPVREGLSQKLSQAQPAGLYGQAGREDEGANGVPLALSPYANPPTYLDTPSPGTEAICIQRTACCGNPQPGAEGRSIRHLAVGQQYLICG
ncbi:unnamed protein product [Gadus morhua 'NCC']